MAGALTDKLRKASGSTRPIVTSLALAKANGATTAELTSGTGWNTTTGVDVVLYRRQLNTTTGLYEKIDGTQTEWVGALTGTTLALPTLPNAGTEPAAGYAADGNTVVYCAPTSQWADDVIDTLLTLFNQDQTLKPGPIQTALGLGTGALNGWNALGFAPNTVTYNGNRSYDMVFNTQDLTTTLSAGIRLRTTRTVAAPTQCTSLNGTTQFYSKTSPAGMTFTDDFVAGAWVKLSSYPSGNIAIVSRYNGTSGFLMYANSSGQIWLQGANAGATNYSAINTYQSIPLNKWVHITAQLDMSAFTATSTTSYIMFDGVDVPATVSRSGTNPTALVQAGNLEVGSYNAGTAPFSGKIAQAFVSSAKITQANIRTLYSQGLTSALITANSIISAYSFDNSINDLNTTNANNLTANGSAVATNADSPMGQQASGLISSTLDYAIIQKAVFSTNTTITVQVPEGCTIPTSGGVSAVVYSSAGKPFGMPTQRGKWTLETLLRTDNTQGLAVANTWYEAFGLRITLPLGEWNLGYQAEALTQRSGAGAASISSTITTTNNTETDKDFSSHIYGDNASTLIGFVNRSKAVSTSAQTPYYYNYRTIQTGSTNLGVYLGDGGGARIQAENSYL